MSDDPKGITDQDREDLVSRLEKLSGYVDLLLDPTDPEWGEDYPPMRVALNEIRMQVSDMILDFRHVEDDGRYVGEPGPDG